MVNLNDIEIISLCLIGNQDAYAEIVNRYKKLVYTISYRLLNDREEANDAAQEAFIRIFRSLSSYNASYKFSTWAVKITTNLCLDIIRKKKIDTISVDEIVYEPKSDDTPETHFLRNERSEKIKNAIQSLSEKYRVPVILFHEHGMSYNEICEIINEPLSIVKNRLHRARRMLKSKLEEARKEKVI